MKRYSTLINTHGNYIEITFSTYQTGATQRLTTYCGELDSHICLEAANVPVPTEGKLKSFPVRVCGYVYIRTCIHI